MKSLSKFLNESKSEQYVDQESIRDARKIVIDLKPGKYVLIQPVNAWVIDMNDKEESTTWIGKSNVPRVMLKNEILKKGTMILKTSFGEELYVEGNKDNPMWLVNPTIFSRYSLVKGQHFDDVRNIVNVVEKL